LPIIDTTLAIARRKVSGRKISDADDQHLHHMLKRALGVKGAVLALYGIAAGFAALGVALSEGRGRVTYAITLIFAAFIGVTSFKVARKEQIEREAAAFDAKGGPAGAGPNKPPREDDGHRRNIAQAEVPGAEPGSDGLILPACPSPLPSPSASSP
jgi:hypothetical protein